MGQVKSLQASCQDKVLAAFSFCRRKDQSSSKSYRYGSLAKGKYDESDEEDAKGMLYNKNLLFDDDDDEEEQIVIITKEKSAKPEQRSKQATGPVDHSVFQEGQGLLDMSGDPSSSASEQPVTSSYDRIMERVSAEQKHEQDVNEVMEEIEDHLDSDEDDTAYLVTKNSGTGGNDALAAQMPTQAQIELDQYGTATDEMHKETSYGGYDQSQQQYYNSGAADGYGQQEMVGAPDDAKYSQYDVDESGQTQSWQQHQPDQQWQGYNDHNSQQDYNSYQQQPGATNYAASTTEADDLLAELDDAVADDDEGLL